MPDAPYRASSSAPFEIEVDLGGKSRRTRYRLDAVELTAEALDKPQPVRRIALSNVAHVELAAFGGTTICTLRARDGARLAFSSGFRATPPDVGGARAFATMLEALNERVASASPDATFVTGSWMIAGAVVVITVLCAGLLASLAGDAASRELLKFKIACVLVALFALVAVPLAFVRGRPKPYDPRKLPRAYDPFPES